MIKPLIICSFFCLAIGHSLANPIEFGVKGGINLAENYNHSLPGLGAVQTREPGFIGGFYLDVPLLNFLSLQPEINLTMRGSHIQYINQPTLYGTRNISVDEVFNYLEIPLFLKAGLPFGSGLKGSLMAGFSYSMVLSADLFDNYTYSYPNGTPTSDHHFYTNGAVLNEKSLVFGIELEYGDFLLDTRWDLGLNPVFQYGFNVDNNVTSDVISVLAGYRIF